VLSFPPDWTFVFNHPFSRALDLSPPLIFEPNLAVLNKPEKNVRRCPEKKRAG